MNTRKHLLVVLAILSGLLISWQSRPPARETPDWAPGMIILWEGRPDQVPAGWRLYAPAQGRFVLGASPQYPLGSTGGASTFDLRHDHEVNLLAAADPMSYASVAATEGVEVSLYAHTHTACGLSAEALGEQSIMPPYIALWLIIREPEAITPHR